MGHSDTESTSSSMRGNPGSPRDISVLLDDPSTDSPGFQHPAPISPSASTSSSETSDLDNSVIITNQTPKRTNVPVIDLTSPDEGDEGAARTHGSFMGNFPCEDFAQFATNYRWRLHDRNPRGQRLPPPDSRLRSRRFPRRHFPYSNLWERVPAPSSRRDPLSAELADLVPRPSPPADSNSPIIIDDERTPFTQHQVPPSDAPSWFLSDTQHRMERFCRRLNATRQTERCYLQSDEALAYRLQQAEYGNEVEEQGQASGEERQTPAARAAPLHSMPHVMHQPLQFPGRCTGRRPFHTNPTVTSDLFLPFVSVIARPPPPLHHYGDSNQGLSADGEDYEALWNLSERIGLAKARGLSKDVIDSIPNFRYSASSRDSSNGNCVVCMSDYVNREKLRRLPCNHDFHAKCIDRWLKNNRTCPVCREEVVES